MLGAPPPLACQDASAGRVVLEARLLVFRLLRTLQTSTMVRAACKLALGSLRVTLQVSTCDNNHDPLGHCAHSVHITSALPQG